MKVTPDKILAHRMRCSEKADSKSVVQCYLHIKKLVTIPPYLMTTRETANRKDTRTKLLKTDDLCPVWRKPVGKQGSKKETIDYKWEVKMRSVIFLKLSKPHLAVSLQ